MKNYTDEEIKFMAGHPDCINSYEINGFLNGFRKAQELFYQDKEDVNSPFQLYSKESPYLPYMYHHLKEEMIFNHNLDIIKKYKMSDDDPKRPPFIFEYKYLLNDGEYDFEIENAKFTHCTVEILDIQNFRTTYITKKYNVIFNK